MARDDDDDDRPKKRSRDDDDDEPRKKRARDDDDSDDNDDDRPRKKRERDDDDADDEGMRSGSPPDGPRKKRSREDDDDNDDDDGQRKKKKKSKEDGLPGLLLAVSIVAMAWGGLNLLSSCWGGISSAITLMNIQNAENAAIAFGGFRPLGFGLSKGYFITHLLVYVLLTLTAAGTLGGGVALMLRKSFGKFLVMGCPGAAVLISFGGIVAGLIFARGFVHIGISDFGFCATIIFNLGVGIFGGVACYNKTVASVLR